MNFNLFDEPKEMMSESLQDSLQKPQTNTQELESIFLGVSLVLESGEMLMGNLVGVELGDNPKIDMKVLTKNCFEFIGKNILTKQKVLHLMLGHDGELIRVSGPFNITIFKIVEMDYQNRACVLAIDLFKDCP